MTATKAIAGSVAANVVTIILWMISRIPGWNVVPDEPKAAIIALVSAGIGAAVVYFAPANKETLAAAAPAGGGEQQIPLGAGRMLAGTN